MFSFSFQKSAHFIPKSRRLIRPYCFHYSLGSFLIVPSQTIPVSLQRGHAVYLRLSITKRCCFRFSRTKHRFDVPLPSMRINSIRVESFVAKLTYLLSDLLLEELHISIKEIIVPSPFFRYQQIYGIFHL